MATRFATRHRLAAALLFAGVALPAAAAPAVTDDKGIAAELAVLLTAARAVVSANENLINDPAIGDKGLSGKVVLGKTLAIYRQKTGAEPPPGSSDSLEGTLLHDQMEAIVAVMDANQATINARGIGFKGFIPAVFGRLVDEAFARRTHGLATIKVTAPIDLVRNRKALPDAWEAAVIDGKFLAADWPKGQPFSAVVDDKGTQVFRMMVPEYYVASCLVCHGEPKGSLDVTGYPREGGRLGQLGSAISITLVR